MKEKELRIALVCFGGVSLAVYMHGISKEILKLVRASSRLHAIADREARAAASFADLVDSGDDEHDTDDIYFDMLRDIGRELELRVVVDVIAGASAGGINGAMLARAISHDLPLGPLRDLWLDHADVGDLLAPEARASAASKIVLKPVVWLLGATGLWDSIRDPEVRRNLSLFVRSRWFKPPLSGPRMSELMYNAVTAMGRPKTPRSSLLPSSQRLDLFVTVTDHHGYQQPIRIHDPPVIMEREHRLVLKFQYQRRPDGVVVSDFDYENASALAFAARATASFPGAFPPTRVAEMDELLARRGVEWPGRADFLARNFEPYARMNLDPATACLLDGSVLNNRPFREAITAIRSRPAWRQVDRRLVYIDPDPAPPDPDARRQMPGFFATLKAALSDLPSAEPVSDELNWVAAFNDGIHRIREIIDEARPHVSALVGGAMTDSFDAPLSATRVRNFREKLNFVVADDAGFAYEGYVRLKLASARSFLAGMVGGLIGARPQSPVARTIGAIIDAWTARSGISYARAKGHAVHDAATGEALEMPRWVRFLLSFDVDFRKRRLHFMIEGLNRLYQMFDEPHFRGHDRGVVDGLKRSFYGCLDVLARREEAAVADAELRALAAVLFADVPPERFETGLDVEAFARDRLDEIEQLVDGLAARIDLDDNTAGIDMLLAEAGPEGWHPDARRDVLINYFGFPYWDVLTFPVMSWRDVGELNTIQIDRISPLDAKALAGFNGAGSLKGVGFAHFAAFFSRAYRENDYLLGRLHALDRLVDIVCNSAGLNPALDATRILALKKRGFLRVLDAEEKALAKSAGLVAALRRAAEALDA